MRSNTLPHMGQQYKPHCKFPEHIVSFERRRNKKRQYANNKTFRGGSERTLSESAPHVVAYASCLFQHNMALSHCCTAHICHSHRARIDCFKVFKHNIWLPELFAKCLFVQKRRENDDFP